MTSLSTNQILSLTRKKLLETTDDLVDDETLLIYLNLTLDDVVMRAFPASIVKSATIAFTGGSGVLPADFGTLYGDPITVDGLVYPELSIQDFTRSNYGVTVEGGIVKIYPTDTAAVTVKYYPTFAALTTAVNPSLPAPFHEALLYGTLYRAFEDLQDLETATYFEKKYEDKLKQKSDVVSSYEETSQRGGQMFNQIDII